MANRLPILATLVWLLSVICPDAAAWPPLGAAPSPPDDGWSESVQPPGSEEHPGHQLPYALLGRSGSTFVVAASDSKHREWADYVCDGVNDQVEIQAAINALPAHGGTVTLLDGTFYISAHIVPRDYTHLRGQGMTQTVLKGTSALYKSLIERNPYNTPENPTSPDHPLVGFQLTDLQIDGSEMPLPPGQPGGKGIFFVYHTDCLFRNVYVRNTPATCFGNDFGHRVLYENCVAEGGGRSQPAVGGHGFGIGTGGYPEEVVIIAHCIALYNYHNGFTFEEVDDEAVSGYAQFSNCYAEGNERGFVFHSATPHGGVYRAKVTGCSAVNNPLVGIYIYRYSRDIIVANNFVANSRVGIDSERGQNRNLIITGNYVTGSEWFGMRLRGTDVVVDGNIVSRSGRDGIRLEGFSTPSLRMLIVNNIIYNNSQAGGYNGIRIDGREAGQPVHDVVIRNNRIYDDQTPPKQQYGVRIIENVTKVTIEGNRFSGNAQGAVYVPNLPSVQEITVQANEGFATEASGTAIVPQGSTVVEVKHGLDWTPPITSISVTPTNDLGQAQKFWISDVGPATFRINVDRDPGSQARFVWQIRGR